MLNRNEAPRACKHVATVTCHQNVMPSGLFVFVDRCDRTCVQGAARAGSTIGMNARCPINEHVELYMLITAMILDQASIARHEGTAFLSVYLTC